MADILPATGKAVEIEEFAPNDDLMPNDGTYFQAQEPEAQARERQEERAKQQAAKPLLKELIIRLQNRIDYYDSVHSIPTADMKDPKVFLITAKANQQTSKDLREELAYYVSLLDQQP